MPNLGRLRTLYLAYLSHPAYDRVIYRTIYREAARKFLQLGVGTGQRALRMIEAASLAHPPATIQFTALDVFEDRSAHDGPGMNLKRAYRLLHATGAQVRLVPGDPFTGLALSANTLGQVDLILISSRLDPRSLQRAWFYMPRLLHSRSQVFLEAQLPLGRTSLRLMDHCEIRALAAATTLRRAA